MFSSLPFYLGFLPLFFCSECSCVFHGYFVHCKQYCKTSSVLSYCKQYFYCTSCSKQYRTKKLICFLLECFWMWTLHVDIQFPTKKFSVKTVDCMFCMQIPVKLKHKSLCSFCNVSNSQYFETWCTLIDCMYLVKWKQEFILSQISSVLVKLVCAEKDMFYFEMKS